MAEPLSRRTIRDGVHLVSCIALLVMLWHGRAAAQQGGTRPATTTGDEVAAPEGVARPATTTSRKVAALGVALDPSATPSPDGRFIAALQTRPQPILWIVPAEAGEPFAFREMWAAYKPRWSPSGDRLGFVAAVGPPRVWTIEIDPESGHPTDPPRLLIRTFAHDFAFSPDGERIALVAQRASAAGASQIDVVVWDSRASRTLLREGGVIHRVDWSPDGRWIYYGLYTGADGEGAFRVMRVPAAGGRPEIVARGEFLGQSTDEGYLLLRPEEPTGDRQDTATVAKAEESPATPEGAVNVEGPTATASPADGGPPMEAEKARLLLHITDSDGSPLWRLELEAGRLPRWGPTASSLLRVLPEGDGDAIWVYEVADTVADESGRSVGGRR